MKTFQQWCASVWRTYAHGSLAEQAWDAAIAECLAAFREGQRKQHAAPAHEMSEYVRTRKRIGDLERALELYCPNHPLLSASDLDIVIPAAEKQGKEG